MPPAAPAATSPTLRTGVLPGVPAVSNQVIHPYTDLLVHDMGAGLADDRPDFQASGREWRTPPLWGIGLVQTVNGHTNFLHDGRARSLLEAVLWHGGEAPRARERVRGFPARERAALVAFRHRCSRTVGRQTVGRANGHGRTDGGRRDSDGEGGAVGPGEGDLLHGSLDTRGLASCGAARSNSTWRPSGDQTG